MGEDRNAGQREAAAAIAPLLERGLAAQRAGELRRAADEYEQALALDPSHVDALQLLAIVCAQLREHARAAALLARAIALRPGDANLRSNRGAVLRSLGRIDEAIAEHDAAVRLEPGLASVHFNRAIALRAGNRAAEAAAAFVRTIELAPAHPDARWQLAASLLQAGELEQAIAAAREAVAATPGRAAAWSTLGAALKAGARYAEALTCQQRAVQCAPQEATLHANVGNTWIELGESARAEAAYAEALRLAPDHGRFHLGMGLACAEQGRFEEAGRSFDRAQALSAAALEPSLRRLQLLPLVFEGRAQMDHWRAEFAGQVRSLTQRIDRAGPGALAGQWVEPPFALQFLDGDLRALKQACARMYAGAIAPRDPIANTGGPRVGFLVTRRHEASFLHGMGALLDRMRPDFGIVVLCDASGADAIRAGLRNPAIGVLPVPAAVEAMAQAVRAARCDVLCYWEVGTDAANYFLPFMRPAPVQCMSWGVQVTSGHPAMDGYLSSRLVEPEDAVTHYTERLLLADTLLTVQRRRAPPAAPDPRPALGLDGDRHLYLCAQQAGKLHPDFDATLAGILRRDARGSVVLLGDGREHWNERLRARLARTLGALAERVRVLPRQPEPEYLALVASADVLLDAPHFAGVNSSYDAFSLGRPVVHRPSPYHRGRYTLGCYRKMGLEDLVVSDDAAYVDLAVALGSQADLREHVRARIAAASEALFDDARAVTETERLLAMMVREARAARG